MLKVGNVLPIRYGDSFVYQRIIDRYFRLSDIYGDREDLYLYWLKLRSTLAFIRLLSSTLDMPIYKLVTRRKNTSEIWVQHEIGVELAKWISHEHGVELCKWRDQWRQMTKDDIIDYDAELKKVDMYFADSDTDAI